jgi:hypothetical protein
MGEGLGQTRVLLGWLGVASLMIACIIGSLTFPKNFLWFFESSVSFVPDLLSGCIAALALFPIWRKGELAAPFKGIAAFALLIPLFYFVSVLVNIALGGSGFGLLKLPTVWLLLIILAMANLNVAKYAELAIIVLLFLVSWNINSASEAMGLFGFPFLLASLCGLILSFDQKKIISELTGRSVDPQAKA